MAKLLMLSVLVLPLLLAGGAARIRNPRRGLRITALAALLYGAAYVTALHFLYFRLP